MRCYLNQTVLSNGVKKNAIENKMFLPQKEKY